MSDLRLVLKLKEFEEACAAQHDAIMDLLDSIEALRREQEKMLLEMTRDESV
jgi:hypothetical protein